MKKSRGYSQSWNFDSAFKSRKATSNIGVSDAQWRGTVYRSWTNQWATGLILSVEISTAGHERHIMYTIYRQTDTRVRIVVVVVYKKGFCGWRHSARRGVRIYYYYGCVNIGGGIGCGEMVAVICCCYPPNSYIYIYTCGYVYICVLHGLHELSMVERKYWSSSSIKGCTRAAV